MPRTPLLGGLGKPSTVLGAIPAIQEGMEQPGALPTRPHKLLCFPRSTPSTQTPSSRRSCPAPGAAVRSRFLSLAVQEDLPGGGGADVPAQAPRGLSNPSQSCVVTLGSRCTEIPLPLIPGLLVMIITMKVEQKESNGGFLVPS